MDYQSLYYLMFNGVTDALKRMEWGQWAEARQALMELQQRAEEVYMEGAEQMADKS